MLLHGTDGNTALHGCLPTHRPPGNAKPTEPKAGPEGMGLGVGGTAALPGVTGAVLGSSLDLFIDKSHSHSPMDRIGCVCPLSDKEE